MFDPGFLLEATKLLPKLVQKLRSVQSAREDELKAISNTFGDPAELAKYYIIPDCQEYNPADYPDREPTQVVREDVFKFLDEYLTGSFEERDGRNQLFLLSDAGMGKTSLLVILKLFSFMSFWPKRYRCELLKLGEDTLDRIEQVKAARHSTVLLLDALDEDRQAWSNMTERLIMLLNLTKNFSRVIITCRTQFFPETGADPFARPGRFELGGYICPAKYLSPFTDAKVKAYLNKRFCYHLHQRWSPSRRRRKEQAWSLAGQMDSLRCRPMLLAYIEDLLESEVITKAPVGVSEFQVYKCLVEAWLLREERKSQGRLSKEMLHRASAALALRLQALGETFVSSDQLKQLRLSDAAISALQTLELTGRSLLTRTSDGGFRFAHYSIQEFLVAQRLLSEEELPDVGSIFFTDKLAQFTRAGFDSYTTPTGKALIGRILHVMDPKRLSTNEQKRWNEIREDWEWTRERLIHDAVAAEEAQRFWGRDK